MTITPSQFDGIEASDAGTHSDASGAVQRVQAQLAAIVESSHDAIASKDLNGIIQSWNLAAERIFGYTAEEMIGKPVTILIPADRGDEAVEIMKRVNSGERIQSFETKRLTKDGRLIDVWVTVSPVRDARGVIIGASKMVRDISDRKRADEELARHRERLEELVQHRTFELERSHQQLRLSERMASIGTLSAGIGHDMGNLIMPINVHIDSLEKCLTDSALRADLAAIRACTGHLQKLARGLGLLTLDPADTDEREEPIDWRAWLADVMPIFRSVLPRGIEFEGRVADGAPPVNLTRHQLTQVVFSLIQNAGQAMKGRGGGKVSVDVEAGPGSTAVLKITDNGVGMSPDVKSRCLEAFFTTRTRALSTGLGLALVAGVVERAGGAMRIESSPGHGSTFSISLPATDPGGREDQSTRIAVVAVTAPRMRGLVINLLQGMGASVFGAESAPAEARLWITDSGAGCAMVRGFLSGDPRRRALVLGGTSEDDRVRATSAAPPVNELRGVLRAELDASCTTPSASEE